MGMLLSLGPVGTSSCIGITTRKNPRVLKIVKPDGTILKYGSPVLVRDIPADVAVSGIGLSKGSSQHLPPDYEMKMGEVYHVLPLPRPPVELEAARRAMRIKVVITKQQLQLLLNQQVSVEEFVARLDRKKAVHGGNRDGGDGSALAWRPSLETIAEGVD